jgi:chorismate mutase
MSSNQNKELEELRRALRSVDDELMVLVAKRVEVIRKIGALKRAQNIPILDAKQETFNMQRNVELLANRVPAEFIEELTSLLAKWSRDIQSSQR